MNLHHNDLAQTSWHQGIMESILTVSWKPMENYEQRTFDLFYIILKLPSFRLYLLRPQFVQYHNQWKNNLGSLWDKCSLYRHQNDGLMWKRCWNSMKIILKYKFPPLLFPNISTGLYLASGLITDDFFSPSIFCFTWLCFCNTEQLDLLMIQQFSPKYTLDTP